MLLTGARPGEAAGLPRTELHSLDHAGAAAWVLPGDRSKNKREHLVPLGSMARQTVADALGLIKESDGDPISRRPIHRKQHKPINTARARRRHGALCREDRRQRIRWLARRATNTARFAPYRRDAAFQSRHTARKFATAF